LRAGKKEDAVKTLGEARAKYPNDAELLRSEVNIYLADQEYAKAEQLLITLTQKDPSSEMFWYVLGITYDKLGKKGDEEKAYQKAIELKPTYYDARFNLGALYFNQGLENDNICNEIPPRETAKYNDCTAASTVLFKKAVEHLEVAYNNVPAEIKGTAEERQIITALKDAYYKAGREEDYKKMKDLLVK
jgi:tetratricopeptide (TPR) repeat protein